MYKDWRLTRNLMCEQYFHENHSPGTIKGMRVTVPAVQSILGIHDPRCLREGLCGIFRQRKGITQRTDTLPQSTGGIAFSHKYDPCSWWPKHLQPEDPPPPIPKTPIIGSCSLAQPYNIPKKWCLYIIFFSFWDNTQDFVGQLHR